MVIRGESFYDWCQRTGNQSFLLQWDYDKNNLSPDLIYKTNNEDFYFKCKDNLHDSYLVKPRTIVHHGAIPKCPICNSFGFWCEKNNRIDLLERWDFNLNTETPYDISISTTNKYYFKCDKGLHQSELKDINNIRKQPGSAVCSQCNSFGEYGIKTYGDDFLDQYWSSQNSIDPMFLSKRSNKQVFIKCQNKDYHPDYKISAANFTNGKRCPYCAGKKVHIFDSLGYLYPKALDKWVEKKKTPFDYLPNSNKKVYWNCCKHGQYRRVISREVEADFICPKCFRETFESKLQHKVNKYISSKYTDVKHERECSILPINPDTNYALPYDNEIVDLKLIIEVNGEQHYKPSSFFYGNDKEEANKQLMHRKKIDAYKKQYAIVNGYNYLEIPYWTDDKKETWKMLIDRKIESIQKI